MFASKEGQNVPQVTFPTRQGDAWVNVTSDELFKGKTVILFSLPGAFTPTCSSSHLPRYNELFPVFQDHGVDEIAARVDLEGKGSAYAIEALQMVYSRTSNQTLSEVIASISKEA